jgi:hypothetical protein
MCNDGRGGHTHAAGAQHVGQTLIRGHLRGLVVICSSLTTTVCSLRLRYTHEKIEIKTCYDFDVTGTRTYLNQKWRECTASAH